jgi:hypothetical protein
MPSSLADEIIDGHTENVRRILQSGVDINTVDEYGFTYLIEAAIADNVEITALLLAHNADTNLPDITGNTALHWAAENNNIALAKILLDRNANPNAYNFAGQPVLAMPVVRQQAQIRKLIQSRGGDVNFARDFINTKLLGHMFELIGTADLISPANDYVEVDFEGFFLEFSIGVISDALRQFTQHFGARKMRQYSEYAKVVVDTLDRANQLIKFMQYRTDLKAQTPTINALIKHEPLIIPIGYEGHAITYVKVGNILAQCDRREDSRHYDNIEIFQINNTAVFNQQFIQDFIYEKKSDHFVNEVLPNMLGLEPITELKIEAQISGNCSWANVEATIPTLLFLLLMQSANAKTNIAQYKTAAMEYFRQWREWNKDRALKFCIRSFSEEDTIRNLCKAEILAAILFQRLSAQNFGDHERIESILGILLLPPYKHVLDNYVKVYCYESLAPEGKLFLQTLQRFGYSER